MRYRDTRRKFSLFKDGLVLLLIIICSFLIIKFLNSTFFQIKTVYLDANREDLQDLSIFQEKQNWLFFEEKKFTDNVIKKYPDIKSVSIKKIFPNILYIKIIPRLPVTRLSVGSQIILYDEDGKIVAAKTYMNTDQLPWINCPETVSLPGLKYIARLIHDYIKVDQLTCLDNETYALYINGTDFILSSASETDKTVASLQFLIKQFRIDGKQPKSADMRFEKPILKFEEAVMASPSGD